MEINNKGNVTKDNLKKVYEDCFKMIMNWIINNSIFYKEEGKKINLDLIKFIDGLENNTEGFPQKDSKTISHLLQNFTKNIGGIITYNDLNKKIYYFFVNK